MPLDGEPIRYLDEEGGASGRVDRLVVRDRVDDIAFDQTELIRQSFWDTRDHALKIYAEHCAWIDRFAGCFHAIFAHARPGCGQQGEHG